jgi:hypothetical protein
MERSGICGTYEIWDGETPAGELEILPQGGYLRFRALCRAEGRALKRLAAECAGRTVPLGVLVPGGSGWALDRRFSPAELRSLGLAAVDRCVVLSAEGDWQPEEAPERLLRDGQLQTLCRGLRGALVRTRAGETELAAPLTEPFPLLPLFCLGSFRRISGRPYLVFGVREGMAAVISPDTGQTKAGDPKTLVKRE